MPQQRSPGFRIVPEAWKEWEFQTCPARLDVVVDRLLALPDHEITLEVAGSYGFMWELRARLDGVLFCLFGSRNKQGAWTAVHVVFSPPRG